MWNYSPSFVEDIEFRLHFVRPLQRINVLACFSPLLFDRVITLEIPLTDAFVLIDCLILPCQAKCLVQILDPRPLTATIVAP